MLALYLLSLGVSAGLIGVFAQHVLESQGYAPAAFRSDIVLASGVACVYVATQLFYMTVVRLLYPTRARGPFFAEALSHMGALILIPHLLSVSVPWPHPALNRIEPLIYLAAFVTLHGFFKLVSFYASVSGTPSGRAGALGWAFTCCLAALGAYWTYHTWLADARQDRPVASEDIAYHRVGDEYAEARIMAEGATISFPADTAPGECLALRWANLVDPETDEEPLETVYVTAVLEGHTTARYSEAVALHPAGWAEFRVPADKMPAGARRCTVTWTCEREPAWRVVVGLPPTGTTNRRLLASGPFRHRIRQDPSPPNFVVVVIEGLGAERLSSFGYDGGATPALDRLAYSALTFPHAYTPAPEAAAACMTLLTGLSPLRHGYLGDHYGPLPESCRTLAELLHEQGYTTAIFTEGEGVGEGDLVFGSGFARGFEVFDASFPGDAPADNADPADRGSADAAKTLAKATAWIDAHADRQFMVFVRLSELRDPTPCARYGAIDTQGGQPRSSDVYDRALAYVDEQVGLFIKHLRDQKTQDNTCLLVTSTYGLDFPAQGNAPPERLLTEACLRVPLFLLAPGIKKEIRAGLIALEDVTPTLLELAGAAPDGALEGRAFLTPLIAKQPVSMMGKPLVLSLRSDRWRFAWQSGQAPFRTRSRSEGRVLILSDVSAAESKSERDSTAQYPDLAARFRDYLETYLDKRCPAGATLPEQPDGA